ERRKIEHRAAGHSVADGAPGAVADDLQRLLLGERGAHRLFDVGRVPDLENVHDGHRQKRGMSGKASWPRCTWMRPSSAQRCSTGNTFPGLSSPPESNAHLTLCCWAMSISLNISGIRSRFSMPTPCSPVSTPPSSTQAR